MNSIQKTDWQMFFVMKSVGLSMCLGAIIMIFGRNLISFDVFCHRIILEAPFFSWGMFVLVAAAEVRAGNWGIEYRRFFKWRQLPYDSIQRCAGSWHLGLGFIARVGDRRRIYFVTLRSWCGYPSDLIKFINTRSLDSKAE